MRYVDFHTHILPKLDDGSRDLSMSLEMLDMLKRENVCIVFATPHFYWYNESIESFLERRNAAAEAVIKAYGDISDMPEIRLGAEIRVLREMPDSSGIERLRLEDTDLMLFELPYGPYSPYMGENIHNIAVSNGITPVIAHAERYLSLYSYSSYDELLSIPNIIFQITSDFTKSKKISSFTAELIRSGIPVIFGSDCHNTDDRPPLMGSTLGRLSRFCSKYKIPEDELETLFEFQRGLCYN